MTEEREITEKSGIGSELRDNLHMAEDICNRLSALNAAHCDDFEKELEQFCQSWQDLPNLPPEYAEILIKKFEDAKQTAKNTLIDAENIKKSKIAAKEQLEKIKKQLEKMAMMDILYPKKADIKSLEEKYQRILPLLEESDNSLVDTFNIFNDRISSEEKANEEKTEIVNKLIVELNEILELEDMKVFQERKNAVDNIYNSMANVPKDVANNYKQTSNKVAAKLSLHYETLDWARSESYTLKLQICEKLEELIKVDDDKLAAASKTLNDIRKKWKSLGAVPKAKFDEINPRYLELTKQLQKRADEYFNTLRKHQKEAAIAKEELCKEAELLADKTAWNETASAFKALQQRWKEIPSSGNAEKELYNKFRSYADKFFNARSEYFDQRNQKFDASANKKRELISQAEKLTENINNESINQAKLLRKEFQSAGSAGRVDNELFATFNSVLDKIFQIRKAEQSEKETKADELIQEIKQLTSSLVDATTLTAEKRFKDICSELKSIACRQTFAAEEIARKHFDEEFKKAKMNISDKQYSIYMQTAPQAANLYNSLKNKETIDLSLIEDLNVFPKLRPITKLFADAVNDDACALEKLGKFSDQSLIEQQNICESLENCAGISASGEKIVLSLAEELTAAIAGNFGAETTKKTNTSNSKELVEAFNTWLVLDYDKQQELIERFNRVRGIVLNK